MIFLKKEATFLLRVLIRIEVFNEAVCNFNILFYDIYFKTCQYFFKKIHLLDASSEILNEKGMKSFYAHITVKLCTVVTQSCNTKNVEI